MNQRQKTNGSERLSVLDDIKLEYCRETLGLNKTEVVKKGIDMVYQQAVNLTKIKQS